MMSSLPSEHSRKHCQHKTCDEQPLHGEQWQKQQTLKHGFTLTWETGTCDTLLCKAAAAALFFALIATQAFAQDYLAVGAESTTWRAGDVVAYQYGCHDSAAMVAVAEKVSNELFYIYGNLDPPRCFVVSRRIPAILLEWIAGPFQDKTGEYIGSVWQVRDLGNDVEYIWLVDHTGPHKSVEARGT